MNLSRMAVAIGMAIAVAGLAPPRAVAQTPETGDAVWASLEGHGQLRSNLRALSWVNRRAGRTTPISNGSWVPALAFS